MQQKMQVSGVLPAASSGAGVAMVSLAASGDHVRANLGEHGPILEGSMPFFVVPLAGPFGLILLLVIAWLSL